jgi:hypothetical protein
MGCLSYYLLVSRASVKVACADALSPTSIWAFAIFPINTHFSHDEFETSVFTMSIALVKVAEYSI